MKFTVSLLELFAYLIPGLLTLAVIVNTTSIATPEYVHGFNGVVILLVGYVVGHAVTVLSVGAVWGRTLVQKLGNGKPREKRYSFYLDLRRRLEELFGEQITKADEYYYSLRIAIDKGARTAGTIDRLYALTLFSRNLTVVFMAASVAYAFTSVEMFLGSFSLTAIFFLRYIQFEKACEGTVLRAAHIALCLE